MKFIYLVQGQADLVSEYFHLKDRSDCEAIYLTYDQELDGAIFRPNTTWAEGRNILLEKALERGPKDYYIFLDDDIKIIRGSWDLFEAKLNKHQPALAVPVVPKTRYTPIKDYDGSTWEIQAFKIHDEQFMAVHKDLIDDNIIFPYITKFDDLSWWAACEIQQILTHTLYYRYAIQFNEIEIENLVHGRHDTKDHSYKEQIRIWINEQLLISYTDIWYYWDDWAGIDKGFVLDELLHDRIQHKRNYEEKFKDIVMTTRLFTQWSQLNKPTNYKLSSYFKKRVFNNKGEIYERIS